MFQRLVEMKQELSKIMGNIVEILTCCDPFPIPFNPKNKNNEKDKEERRVEG